MTPLDTPAPPAATVAVPAAATGRGAVTDPGETTGSGVAPAIASARAGAGVGGTSTGAAARRGAGGGAVTGVVTGGRTTAVSVRRRNALPEDPGGGLAAFPNPADFDGQGRQVIAGEAQLAGSREGIALRYLYPACDLDEGFNLEFEIVRAILGFEHPITKEPLRFERPPPADMADLIEALRAMPQ